jgi:hypothetical protein
MMKALLLNVDLFAPHFEFYVKNNSTRYNTKLGGVATLIICSISLVYTVLNIKAWANNEMQPIVTQYTSLSH